MGIKLDTWDEAKTKAEILKRYKNASSARSSLVEDRWIRNERTVYASTSFQNLSYLQNSLESNYSTGIPSIDGSNSDVNSAQVFKNFRFIHAQMSSNPPTVAMRPASSDQEDHRKADAADRIVRWALRKYNLQEKVDQLSLNALLYGTAFIKTVWDASRGDIMGFDKEKEEIQLEGDIAITVPFLWNMYVDPDARSWDECKYVLEEVYMDFNEALIRFGRDKEDQLKAAMIEDKQATQVGKSSNLQQSHYNSVRLIEYWEIGLPSNGYLGRFCITTINGDVLEPCRPSPYRFKAAGAVSKIESSDLPDEVKEARIESLPEKAHLPYHVLSDIDIPNMIWGKSFVEYASQLQDNLNKMDTAVLDNIQAHGVARMILPESAEINEESLTNSPWDVVKITGNQPPYFMSPPQLMPDMTTARVNHQQAIDAVSGVNENMFGQQSREQSGASMQYATNQGNMVRRRLFNKYVLAVESLYKGILNLVRKHWTVARVIHVIGKEKALEAIDVKGSDIDGGYDVVGEYGVTLSLDPITRREEILTLQPLFEKAGVPARTGLRMLKLNELEGMYDKLDMAANRQKAIFDEMIATGRYIAPKRFRDHENMIAWALDYFMSQEFESLPEDIQALCERHIEERTKVAASETSGGAAPAAAAPAPAQELQAAGPLPAIPTGPV